jgi:hypothetical protein
VTTAPHMRTLKKPALHHERPDNSLYGTFSLDLAERLALDPAEEAA